GRRDPRRSSTTAMRRSATPSGLIREWRPSTQGALAVARDPGLWNATLSGSGFDPVVAGTRTWNDRDAFSAPARRRVLRVLATSWWEIRADKNASRTFAVRRGKAPPDRESFGSRCFTTSFCPTFFCLRFF